jgi:hypothetical protein
MDLRVIGAGYGRTGTLSMKSALEQLGVGPCHHMFEVFARPDDARGWAAAIRGEAFDADALLDGFRSTVDFPACLFWRQLAEAQPAAKVLLTVRPADEWWRSFDATIGRGIHASESVGDAHFDTLTAAIDDVVFDGRADDHDTAVAAYERHNAEVVAAIESERLLVYEVGSGWEPLCDFLGFAVPDEAFPHSNTTAEFKRNFDR